MPHVDLTYLKELAGGNEEFLNDMIQKFVQKTPDELAELQTHLKDKNWTRLRAIAHKMRQALSFMGIKELEDIVASIEDFAKDEKNLDQLPELVESTVRITNESLEELKETQSSST